MPSRLRSKLARAAHQLGYWLDRIGYSKPGGDDAPIEPFQFTCPVCGGTAIHDDPWGAPSWYLALIAGRVEWFCSVPCLMRWAIRVLWEVDADAFCDELNAFEGLETDLQKREAALNAIITRCTETPTEPADPECPDIYASGVLDGLERMREDVIGLAEEGLQ